MRFLFVLHDFLPAHWSGTEIYAYHLARELSREHEVTFFYTEARSARPVYEVRRGRFGGLATVEVNNPQRFRRLSDTFAPAGIERIFGQVLKETKPDLVHFHHLQHLSLNLPLMAKDAGAPVVFTLHDYFLTCPRGGLRRDVRGRLCPEVDPKRCGHCMAQNHSDLSLPAYLGKRLLGAASGRVAPARLASWQGRMQGAWRKGITGASRVIDLPEKYNPGEVADEVIERRRRIRALSEAGDLFIAPSFFLRNDCILNGLPPGKVVRSDYGFAKLPKRAKKRGGRYVGRRDRRDRRELRVGFVGTLAEHKGPHVLLEALELTAGDGVRGFLFGDPRAQPCYSGLLAARTAGIGGRMMGPLPHHAIEEAYSMIDVLAVPSLWYENSPLTIHEAFQRGLPVVASDLGGMRELLSAGGGLVFPAGDAAALAERLEVLQKDRALGEELARGAPPVKDIARDAEWHDGIYRSLTGRLPRHVERKLGFSL